MAGFGRNFAGNSWTHRKGPNNFRKFSEHLLIRNLGTQKTSSCQFLALRERRSKTTLMCNLGPSCSLIFLCSFCMFVLTFALSFSSILFLLVLISWDCNEGRPTQAHLATPRFSTLGWPWIPQQVEVMPSTSEEVPNHVAKTSI